jgi:hypothetical protein
MYKNRFHRNVPQGEDLYAIKLYKGRNEFLQFVPDRPTPLKIFPLKGVHIKVTQS